MKTAEEITKTGIIKDETTEIEITSEKMEEIISDEIIEILIKMEIINLGTIEIIEITEDSKTEIEIIKVVEETLETDKTTVIFLIEADLTGIEMTLDETTETFQIKRRHNRKFQHLQWLKKEELAEKEKENSIRKNTRKIEETGNSRKKNFVLTLEKMTKRKRKTRNRKRLSKMKLSELKERA